MASRSMITYTPSRGRVRIRWPIFETRWLRCKLLARAVTRKKLIISVNPAWLMSYYSFRGLPSVHLRGARVIYSASQSWNLCKYTWIRISLIIFFLDFPWFKEMVDFFFCMRNKNATKCEIDFWIFMQLKQVFIIMWKICCHLSKTYVRLYL